MGERTACVHVRTHSYVQNHMHTHIPVHTHAQIDEHPPTYAYIHSSIQSTDFCVHINTLIKNFLNFNPSGFHAGHIMKFDEPGAKYWGHIMHKLISLWRSPLIY